MNHPNENIVPLFLRIYRFLSAVAIIALLAAAAIVYFWLNQKETITSSLDAKMSAVELDQKAYQAVKDALNKKKYKNIFFPDDNDYKAISDRDPFF